MLDDGSLVYTGLLEKSFKAGETKEISLVLSTQIDNNKAKQIVNHAEILDVTNDRGFQDIDSIAGNAIEYEDDYGKVALLITVSTGRIINYSLIVISIISFICVLVLGKIFLKEKIYK
jgi:signal transduction histidine kinase